jgi:hypothetical protein
MCIFLKVRLHFCLSITFSIFDPQYDLIQEKIYFSEVQILIFLTQNVGLG